MKKKIFIILAIVVPAIILSSLLFLNKDKIGTQREYTTKTFKVDGITCQGCASKIENALKKKEIKNIVVNIEKKTATLTFDKNNLSQDTIKEMASKEGYTFKNMGNDKLEVINYKIKMN
ncbi:hypothetical protein DID78_02845 [Candidatus Marinamargulisbacteria bacterium SCGC AG-343-D04]|nr:hypothetical protein DID78_02845 [Candidatus Marinamargulisbacteria bacterium SCGC AG-343-D04]